MLGFISKYLFLILSFLLSLALLFSLLIKHEKKDVVYKIKLVSAIVNIIIIISLSIVYYFKKEAKIIQYLTYGYVLLFAAIFTIFEICGIIKSNQEKSNFSVFKNSLGSTAWNVYFLCDRKDRIKEISNSMLMEIGLSRDEVIGKKAFDIFDETVRFTRINDIEITNAKLKEYYKGFAKETRPGDEVKREIYMQNSEGQTVLLNLVERPIFNGKRYIGRLNIGQKKNDASLAQVERDLAEKNQDLESIQYKFIAALELTDEAIFFYDLNDNSIWGNDAWVSEFKLQDNTVSMLDYRQLIAKEDVEFYINKIKSLTPESPTYEIRYRLLVDGTYQFVKEKGKRIFDDPNQSVILGFAKKYNSSFFEYTGIKEVDSLKTTDQLLIDVEDLFKTHRAFQLVCINLTSLPEINAQHGRQIGNIVLAEYLKRIKTNFLTESSDIYRASGLVFYFTITDVRKMEFFKKCLISNEKSMNLSMQFGETKIELSVNLGIADAITDGLNKEELIKNCNSAINISLNPKYSSNYAYFGDIKDYIINK